MSLIQKFAIPFALACLFAYGLGYGHIEDAGDVARSIFFTATTAFLYSYSLRRNWASTLVCILGLIFALYMLLGAGVDYGRPNMSLVASLLETNPDEGLEYLSDLNWRDCVLSLLVIGLLSFYRFWAEPQPGAEAVSFSKILWALLLTVSLFGLFSYHTVRSFKQYVKEKDVVGVSLHSVKWNIEKVHRNSSLKVLVIGESVNKRYLSLMGSNWNTTPFLASSPQVTAYTQYHSPAPNTVASLSRTLTFSNMEDGSFDLNRNVVALAKAAGYGTLWVSNQRSMGPNDSHVARMGHQADHHRFLDKVPVIEPVKDDFALLNYLESRLTEPGEMERDSMVFLHMIGSHPHACTRVGGMGIELDAGNGRHINCYLTSLQKLDIFMQKLTQLLAKHSEQYEILYVSDHSLRVAPLSTTEKWMDRLHLPTKNIYVQPQVREAYDAPLFFIASSQKQARKDATPLSGFDFFHLFGNWLGVEGAGIKRDKKLSGPSSSGSIQVFNWSRMVPVESLQETEVLHPHSASKR